MITLAIDNFKLSSNIIARTLQNGSIILTVVILIIQLLIFIIEIINILNYNINNYYVYDYNIHMGFNDRLVDLSILFSDNVDSNSNIPTNEDNIPNKNVKVSAEIP